MGNVTVSEVSVLNEKIEKINKQKTKVETQEEMLRTQLSRQLKEYADAFGINLEGKNLTETKELIKQEVKKVRNMVDSEYELKEQVVQLIEEGNISEANKLLGVEDTSEVAETAEELTEEELAEDVEETSSDSSDFTEDEDDFGIKESPKTSKMGMSPLSESLKDLEVEDADDVEIPVIDDDDDDALSLEEDDFGDFGFGDILKGGKLEL